MNQAVSEKQKVIEKEKVILGLFVSVKGMIDRAGISNANEPNASSDGGASESEPESVNAQQSSNQNIVWICDTCTFQTKSENVLNEHKRVDHTGPKRPTIYICDLCEKTCNTQTEFKKHAEDIHKPKKCNDCDFLCNGQSLMSDHRKQ